jgi:predicted metal-binding protein
LLKIAIIVRNETLDKCTGKGCLNAFFRRLDAFAPYDENVQLVGFTQDSGDLEKKIAKLKDLGVDVVHLSSCIRGKSADYELLAKRLAQDFAVVGYTHGAFDGRKRQAICLAKGGAPVGQKGQGEN